MLELLKNGTVAQLVIVIGFVVMFGVLVVKGLPIPSEITTILGMVVAFYFGKQVPASV